jgi:hypothetical protein
MSPFDATELPKNYLISASNVVRFYFRFAKIFGGEARPVERHFSLAKKFAILLLSAFRFGHFARAHDYLNRSATCELDYALSALRSLHLSSFRNYLFFVEPDLNPGESLRTARTSAERAKRGLGTTRIANFALDILRPYPNVGEAPSGAGGRQRSENELREYGIERRLPIRPYRNMGNRET